MAEVLQPINITASTTLNEDSHLNTVITLSAAAGLTVTLPASTGKGNKYRIYVNTTVTSNNYIIQVANSTDVIQGAIHLTTDIAGTSMPTSSNTDTITMNGSTTGGLRGSYVELEDAVAGFWSLRGALLCTGTEATPFSAAV